MHCAWQTLHCMFTSSSVRSYCCGAHRRLRVNCQSPDGLMLIVMVVQTVRVSDEQPRAQWSDGLCVYAPAVSEAQQKRLCDVLTVASYQCNFSPSERCVEDVRGDGALLLRHGGWACCCCCKDPLKPSIGSRAHPACVCATQQWERAAAAKRYPQKFPKRQ
jgi:hypothetical protein